jgi:hypothetical protein
VVTARTAKREQANKEENGLPVLSLFFSLVSSSPIAPESNACDPALSQEVDMDSSFHSSRSRLERALRSVAVPA